MLVAYCRVTQHAPEFYSALCDIVSETIRNVGIIPPITTVTSTCQVLLYKTLVCDYSFMKSRPCSTCTSDNNTCTRVSAHSCLEGSWRKYLTGWSWKEFVVVGEILIWVHLHYCRLLSYLMASRSVNVISKKLSLITEPLSI